MILIATRAVAYERMNSGPAGNGVDDLRGRAGDVVAGCSARSGPGRPHGPREQWAAVASRSALRIRCGRPERASFGSAGQLEPSAGASKLRVADGTQTSPRNIFMAPLSQSRRSAGCWAAQGPAGQHNGAGSQSATPTTFCRSQAGDSTGCAPILSAREQPSRLRMTLTHSSLSAGGRRRALNRWPLNRCRQQESGQGRSAELRGAIQSPEPLLGRVARV